MLVYSGHEKDNTRFDTLIEYCVDIRETVVT